MYRVLWALRRKKTGMIALWERASITWCGIFRSGTLWPVHGHYRCPACLRIYAVRWQEGVEFLARDAVHSRRKAPKRTVLGGAKTKSGTYLGSGVHNVVNTAC